jgi:nitroreductase
MTDPAQLLSTLRWRYATKQFDPSRKIPAATWEALLDSLVLTPSSFGLQPWKFLIIDSPELKAKLRPLSWNQAQVTDCDHHVVFLGRTGLTAAEAAKLITATATARGIPREALAGYEGMLVKHAEGHTAEWLTDWATRQVYIALGQFMLACAELGVDACPMEGFDPVAYDKALGLEGTGYHAVVACPVGYRAAGDKYATAAKIRYPRAELVEVR